MDAETLLYALLAIHEAASSPEEAAHAAEALVAGLEGDE